MPSNLAGSNVAPAIFSDRFRTALALKRAAESAQGAYRGFLGQCKAQDGIAPVEITEAIKDYRADPEDLARGIARRIRNQQYLGRTLEGLPMFGSAENIPEETHRENALMAAQEAGRASGQAGARRVEDNPFAPGTESHVAWDAGYLEGQADLAAGLARKPRAKAADVTRRPGRPRKNPLPGKLTPDTAADVAAQVAADDAETRNPNGDAA